MSWMLSFIKKHRVAITVIVTIQALLCINDAVGDLRCNATISDCGPWTWLTVRLVNFPFSIIIDELSALLASPLVIEHFKWSVVINFFLYFFGGSLWWLIVVTFSQWCWRSLKKEKIGNA